MSLVTRIVAVAFALVLDVVAVGLMRGEIPIGIRGTDERIEGAPAFAIGVLVLAGACWVLYAAVSGQ